MHQLTRSEFKAGAISVDQAAVRLTVAGFQAWSYVLLQASADNTDIVYVGHDAHVSASNGWPLDAGESVEIPIDDPSKIWIIGGADDQTVKWLFA